MDARERACAGNPGPKTGSPLSRGRTDVAWLRVAPHPGHGLMDALPEFALVRAATLDDVLRARANHPASSLLGGGTDLVVNIRRGIIAPPVLIDVNHVEELRAIRADARSLEIGAAVKLAELAADAEVTRHYPVVAQAAGFIAGPTHRNMGTVGGNLCLDTRCLFYNQSEWWRAANHHCLKTTGDICHVAPKSRGVCFATFSGDLAPALLILDTEVDIAGPASGRTMPLAALYIGYARQDYPVTGAAVALRRDGDTLTDLRVAFTGTNPRPVRLAGTGELYGGALDARVFAGLDALIRDQIMAVKTTFTPGHYRRRVAGDGNGPA